MELSLREANSLAQDHLASKWQVRNVTSSLSDTRFCDPPISLPAWLSRLSLEPGICKKDILGQWSLNFSTDQDYLEGILKHSPCGTNPRESGVCASG